MALFWVTWLALGFATAVADWYLSNGVSITVGDLLLGAMVTLFGAFSAAVLLIAMFAMAINSIKTQRFVDIEIWRKRNK